MAQDEYYWCVLFTYTFQISVTPLCSVRRSALPLPFPALCALESDLFLSYSVVPRTIHRDFVCEFLATF